MSSPSPSVRPSELAITVAALPASYHDREGWQSADEIRGRLALLGFDCTTQQLAAWMVGMTTCDAPWLERRRTTWGKTWEYRVTRYGTTDISNRLPFLKTYTPWLETMRTAA